VLRSNTYSCSERVLVGCLANEIGEKSRSSLSREQKPNTVPVRDKRQLVEYFEAGIKRPRERGIGTEHEKFGVWSDTLQPVSYGGDRGISALFQRLSDEYDWEPELDQGHVISLVSHHGGALTLEPGGQFELSGRVARTIHQAAEELDNHIDELRDISQDLGITWLGAGCHPLAKLDDIPWMPKSRYALMKPFLGKRGTLAHHMMKATCTIQVNFDYTSEPDAQELVLLSARLSPLVTAAFANSSLLGRQDTGFASFRSHIWRHTDADRCGTPAFMLDGSFSFERYTDYLLGIPMMFVKRSEGYIDSCGQPFGEFIAQGCKGANATMGDWELHVSTAFPDVRLKQFIEVRGADGGGRDAILAVPALWKGLLYDQTARDEATALVDGMTVDEHTQFYTDVAQRGVQADWRGRRVCEVARQLTDIAAGGLDRQADSADPESRYLEPVTQWLDECVSPADRMRTVWRDSGEDPLALVDLLLIG
jgi:glutamate--cysteine ligase